MDNSMRCTLSIILNKDKSKVLMSFHTKQQMYNFVGGHIEEGEDELAASYREVFEETGISSNDIVLNFLGEEHTFISYSNFEFYLYITTGVVESDIELKPEKNPLFWADINDLDKLLYNSFGEGNCYVYLKRALELLKNI